MLYYISLVSFPMMIVLILLWGFPPAPTGAIVGPAGARARDRGSEPKNSEIEENIRP